MLTLASTIDAVQVYRRGATVFRTAQLTVEGLVPEEVEIADLPLSLLDPTVRVRVLGAAEVVAAGVRVGLWVRPGDPPPKAPEQAELDDLRRRLRRGREQLAQLDRETELLASVQVPERPRGEDGKAPPPSPMAARLQLEQFVDDATDQRLREARSVRELIRTLEEEERRVLERIAAASSAAEVHLEELRKSAVIRLRARAGAPAVTTLTLELSYVVPGARWAPAYQCKLARDGSRAEIQLRAWVAQRTGEDWKGVRMRLSTASPLRFTELPELAALKIGRAQPPAPKKGFRPPPRGAEALFRDFDRDLQRTRGLLPSTRSFSPPHLEEPSSPRPARSVMLAKGGALAKSAPAPTHTLARPARSAPALRDDTGEMLAEAAALDALDGLDSLEDVDEALAFEEEAPRTPASFAQALPAAAGPVRGAPLPPPSAPAPARKRAPLGGRPPDDVLEAVVFPLLRLPGPDDDAGRGRLMPVDVRQLYHDSLGRIGRPVRFDVASAVRHAEEVAGSVAATALPEGAVDADDISSHFDFAYEADGTVEVTADGGFHSIALGDRASEARMRYIAVPREELAVYRVAMLTNPIPAPLLPGPAEVYVGGEYVLTTRLPTVPARGELKLGLGVEQSIKIARNARFQEVRSGEKVVAMTELVHDVDIDIVNHVERDIDIEVRERVPVPAPGAEVVVEEGPVEPPWQPYDQEERGQPVEGGRRWEIQIARGAAHKLRARYVVKIYANNEIVGGNRREQ